MAKTEHGRSLWQKSDTPKSKLASDTLSETLPQKAENIDLATFWPNEVKRVPSFSMLWFSPPAF